MIRSNVIVTDGDQRAALAVVRSLGAAGHRVIVCESVRGSLAGVSRFAAGTTIVADPLRDEDAFVFDLTEAVKRHAIDCIIPITEPSTIAVLRRRNGLANVCVPAPGLDAFLAVHDKQRVMEAASEVGICVPQQQVVRSRDQGLELLAQMQFPLVLKPARSVGEANGFRRKVAVAHAQDAPAYAAALRDLPDQAFPLLVQQRIVGPGVGIFLLLWNGKRFATFSHRRIREKPPAGGVSVYRESIRADPRLVELSETLLRRFAWQGVAMVEYKVEAATGTPYLMEVNGRFWGSLQLAIDAGVDFPRLLLALARGEEATPVTQYRIGVRSRWWLGDVDHLILRLIKGSDELSLPPGSAGRLRAVTDFLHIWHPADKSEIFRWSDVRPAVTEFRSWLGSLRG